MSDQEINAAIERLAHTHQLAIEDLTESQIADAIKQAILSGDFQRNISANSQSVTYTPYRKLKDAERERDEALMALKCIDEAILVMKPRHIGQPDMDGRYPCWSVWLPKSGRVERKSLQDALLEFAAQIKEETK